MTWQMNALRRPLEHVLNTQRWLRWLSQFVWGYHSNIGIRLFAPCPLKK
jgi:hypothetical protein